MGVADRELSGVEFEGPVGWAEVGYWPAGKSWFAAIHVGRDRSVQDPKAVYWLFDSREDAVRRAKEMVGKE